MPPREPAKSAPAKSVPAKSVSNSGVSAKKASPSTPRAEPRPTNVAMGTRNDRSYLNTKTGVQLAAPKYKAASIKGLTSSDPANVARNRAGAENISRMEARRDMGRNKQVIGDNNGPAANRLADSTAAPVIPTRAAPTAAPRTFVPAPVGYRPGIDPEHRYYQAATPMKKGGKVKPKGKK